NKAAVETAKRQALQSGRHGIAFGVRTSGQVRFRVSDLGHFGLWIHEATLCSGARRPSCPSRAAPKDAAVTNPRRKRRDAPVTIQLQRSAYLIHSGNGGAKPTLSCV